MVESRVGKVSDCKVAERMGGRRKDEMIKRRLSGTEKYMVAMKGGVSSRIGP